jgi:tetratricopeptide (TPR) repeat protein
MAHGQPEAAMAWVERVALPQAAARGRFCTDTLQLVAERGRVMTACGSAAAAHEFAAAELQALRRQLDQARLPDAEARLHLACGQALQALGNLPRAEQQLRAALALRLEHDDPASLWLADSQIALAKCLAQQRRRDEARALLDKARAIRAQHPALAPHLVAAMQDAAQEVEAA